MQLDHSTGMPLRMDGGISFTSAAVQLSSAVQHAPMQHAPMSALSYSTHRTASAPNMGAVLRAAERQAARAARLVQELQAQASPTTHGMSQVCMPLILPLRNVPSQGVIRIVTPHFRRWPTVQMCSPQFCALKRCVPSVCASCVHMSR